MLLQPWSSVRIKMKFGGFTCFEVEKLLLAAVHSSNNSEKTKLALFMISRYA
ncbi:hypothetical protein SAMN05192553_1251 [Cyclobacterium xiamenense]|uniref:Uncharacterized protein n=1 Tax=Cyclobacterium xiamenense TaxID=1297121 RepID=A0A1H7C1C4_9BACT|nr:hypothetical protein SAMN05192553_1251 [Cyclobacterium xiamenense]